MYTVPALSSEETHTLMTCRSPCDGDGECVLIDRSLEQLLVSLQWGRQQTYYPSAQPLSTGELAVANRSEEHTSELQSR